MEGAHKQPESSTDKKNERVPLPDGFYDFYRTKTNADRQAMEQPPYTDTEIDELLNQDPAVKQLWLTEFSSKE